MPKYLLAYHGGGRAPETEEAQAELIAAWGEWFGRLGDRLLDTGNPTISSVTLTTEGIEDGGGINPVSGYSLVTANDLVDAAAALSDCPIFAAGGSIEIAELEEL